MHVSRFLTHSRRHVWIAVLAILWQALLPLSNAFAGQTAPTDGWTPVCSATGLKWIKVDDHASTTDPVAHEDRAHCPLCSFNGADHVLVDTRNPITLHEPDAHTPTGALATPAYTTHSSAPPPARAPPTRS